MLLFYQHQNAPFLTFIFSKIAKLTSKSKNYEASEFKTILLNNLLGDNACFKIRDANLNDSEAFGKFLLDCLTFKPAENETIGN